MKRIILIAAAAILSLSVNAQNFAIAPTAFNVLYRGVDNPLKIAVENYDCDSIIIYGDGMIKRAHPCEYMVTPGRTNSARIQVSGIRNHDTIMLGSYVLRVLDLPDPDPRIAGKSGGAIPLTFLLSNAGISADLDDFIFEVHFKVKSYTAVLERKEHILLKKEFDGSIFPNELKSQFSNLGSGDIVRFEDIVAAGPDGSDRDLASMSFTIR